MTFKKGYTPWNKGLKGIQPYMSSMISHNKEKGVWNKGIPHTEKHKESLRKAKKKEKGRPWAKSGMKISCSKCDKLIYKNKYILDNCKNHYCSRICANKIKSKKQIELARDLGRRFGKNKLSERHKKILSKLRKKDFKEGKFIFPIKDTSIEIKIQDFLKQLGIEFFTHQYMKEIEHGYQCDVLIPSMNLVIECDGNYWHKYPIGLERDHIRTKELIEKGFKVLRLWESEIKVMELNNFKRKLNL